LQEPTEIKCYIEKISLEVKEKTIKSLLTDGSTTRIIGEGVLFVGYLKDRLLQDFIFSKLNMNENNLLAINILMHSEV